MIESSIFSVLILSIIFKNLSVILFITIIFLSWNKDPEKYFQKECSRYQKSHFVHNLIIHFYLY